MEYRRAWAEINLDNLAQNLQSVKGLLSQIQGRKTGFMAIVKADGYGHGGVQVARELLADRGISSFGVAICEEGIQLRDHQIRSPILIMGFTPESLLEDALRNDLTQTIFSVPCAHAAAAAAARLNRRAVVHIKIDTGMSRLGFLPSESSIRAICEIASHPNLHIQGIYTHFATSDALDASFMFEQRRRFIYVLRELEKRKLHIPVRHIANSGAVVQCLRGADEDLMDIVRAGILLYGLAPSYEIAADCASLKLSPVMRFMSRISSVKEVPAGVGVSYGHIYRTTRPTTIAVIPVGYADGYPRRLSRGGQVLIRGKFAPIAGAICMDQCMVDVTDIPGVAPGDPVVLLGGEGPSADELAETVGTISYEIVCGIGKRVPRVYIKNGEVVKAFYLV